MKLAASVPRVAFVVDLTAADRDEANVARMHHLVHLFSGHRLPATWAVDSPEQVESLGKQHSTSATIEAALKIDQQWLSPLSSHSQFRAALDARLSAVAAAGGASTPLVVGDPRLLRPRAAILAEQGIAGIFAPQQNGSTPAKLRPLPCGLWQLEPSFCIPPKRSLLNFWTRRCPSTKQLLATAGADTTLVMVQSSEFGRSGASALQGLEKLLREISWAASRDQLTVSTVGEMLAELADQRAVKPQRSILRAAA